jgi:hypothetical protein
MEYFHNSDSFLIGILFIYVVKYSTVELGMGDDQSAISRQNTHETQEQKNSLRISGAKPNHVLNGSSPVEDLDDEEESNAHSLR